MAFLDETGLTYLWKKIKLAPYPVGSIYTSENSTSPAELFGGTWERLKDRFLLAASDTYAAGSTGGDAQHTLTEDEMPNHSHNGLYWRGPNQEGIQGQFGVNNYTDGYIKAQLKIEYKYTATSGGFATGFSGGSKPHNNMPPYLAVYMWKRIA